MKHQIIGLILLIAAVSTVLYVATNYAQLPSFRFPNMPSFKAVDYVPGISLPEYGGNQQAPVIENATPPITVTSIKPQTPYEYGEIVLTADWNLPASGVDIKGWKIGSLENEYNLPGAQDVYTFGGSQNSLMVKPGDEVHIYSGVSPRGNFRINKCSGYFSEFGSFNPPLEQRCPAPSYEETNYLSNACKSYISSLSACQTPSQAPISSNDAACHDYLNNINYESCVSKHRYESDFSERAIWVWAGDNLKYFDQGGDIIRIFDKSGKLVSQYRY